MPFECPLNVLWMPIDPSKGRNCIGISFVICVYITKNARDVHVNKIILSHSEHVFTFINLHVSSLQVLEIQWVLINVFM